MAAPDTAGAVAGPVLGQCVRFGRMLRRAGVPVTPAQLVDLAHALAFVGVSNKEDFRLSAQAILVNRPEHLAIFAAVFERFWRRPAAQQPDMPPTVRRRTDDAVATWQVDTLDLDADDTPHIDRTARYSAVERLRQADFGRLDAQELAAVQAQLAAMRWQVRPRRTRRFTAQADGRQVDLRRTIRHSLRHGGEPLTLARRRRKIKPRPLVVLCDVSGSMERYSRVLLQFLYVVANRLARVEAFAFSTRLSRLTRQLRAGTVDIALDRAVLAVHDWGSGTRIGAALHDFNDGWAPRVLGRGAVVLIVSDGWDRGDVTVLAQEMARLRRRARRVFWLNPLLGDPEYAPLVRGMQAALPFVDELLPVHNLASLEQLAIILRQL